ncbi:hypothetical protein [Thalassotalea sp. PS06]|uniref:hypothetical protein n=1 Tax=Thalassotalea sp. PS06 TaxID=2594005 RepID=UPI0011648C66|nr:hypothetical protein [Thalassotalea sp. PS06]QDP00043.1 hypothetical protein FNC98_00990 [Thalassotalea sp. PS06]
MTQKTIRELITEMNHRNVSLEEIELARAYEKSLIPDDTEIPDQDSIYEVFSLIEGNVLIQFCAPFTGGNDVQIPKGIRLRVLEHCDEKPLVIACSPIDSEEHSDMFVDKKDLNNDLYAGYYLTIPTLSFIRNTKKIS